MYIEKNKNFLAKIQKIHIIKMFIFKYLYMSDFPKQYNPKEAEIAAQKLWNEAKISEPKSGKTGNTFHIPIPPPNVTGNLHMGHAVMLVLQDIMVRYNRMK